MANYDHPAIRKAYPNVFMIDDGTETIVDEDGNPVTIDQTRVDAARVELNKLLYQEDRARAYPEIGEQLDMLFHAIDSGKLDKTSDFYKELKKVKDANPKS